MTKNWTKIKLTAKRITYVFPCPKCKRHIGIQGINHENEMLWKHNGEKLEKYVRCSCGKLYKIKIMSLPEASNVITKIKEIKDG